MEGSWVEVDPGPNCQDCPVFISPGYDGAGGRSASELRKVALRVLFELCDAWFATEFHFLVAVDLSYGCPHRSKFVAGDDAGVARVRLHAGTGGASTRGEEDGGEESQ